MKSFLISEYLLSLDKTNTDVKNDYGDTALHWACYSGATTQIVRKIVSKSDPETINSRDSIVGYTPIICAVMNGRNKLVRLLARMEMVNWDKDELVRVAR